MRSTSFKRHFFNVASIVLLCATIGIREAGGQQIPAAAAGGNLRYSITVSKFANEAGWRGQWDIGDGFSTIMTDALQASGKFIVLGDAEMRGVAMAEQDLAASGRVAGGGKAPATGQMTPAQLLVRGSITHVQDSTTGGTGGVAIRGIRLGGGKDNAEVNITIYLVDSRTGQVKASTKVVGKSAKRAVSVGYSGSALGGLTGNVGGHMNDNVGKACADAVAQAVDFLAGQLGKIPWQGSVALVKDDSIIINRGTREGVRQGMLFDVGKTEEIVDDDTGEILDSSLTKFAKLEVTEVREKVAYCKVVDGGEGITKGMAIFPVGQ